MLKRALAIMMIAILTLAGSALAEGDWAAAVLADEAVTAEYPYHALIDLGDDGAPLLAVSTTEEAFIGDEDRAVLYLCAGDEPKSVMEIGGNAGEKFYASADEHTLTYYYRYSGESHFEVYTRTDDALELVTKLDAYAPMHAPEGYDSDKDVYLQDGEAVDEAAFNALRDRYAGEANEVTYTAD